MTPFPERVTPFLMKREKGCFSWLMSQYAQFKPVLNTWKKPADTREPKRPVFSPSTHA